MTVAQKRTRQPFRAGRFFVSPSKRIGIIGPVDRSEPSNFAEIDVEPGGRRLVPPRLSQRVTRPRGPNPWADHPAVAGQTRAAEAALSEVLGGPIRLEWDSLPASVPTEAALTVVVGWPDPAGGPARWIAVVLPEEAAAAFIQRLQSALGTALGGDGLSEVDRGLLDYAVAATACALARHAPIGITHLIQPQAYTDWLMEHVGSLRWHPLKAYVGAAATRFILAVPHDLQEATLAGGGSDDAPVPLVAPPSSVRCRLLLGPVDASDVDASALRAGDVFLVSCTRLEACVGRVWLVSDAGWIVAPVTVGAHTPTTIQVEAGPPAVRPWPGQSGEPGQAWIELAALDLPAERLDRLAAGVTLDLPHDPADATLLIRGAVPRRGELVRVDGELGLRIRESAT